LLHLLFRKYQYNKSEKILGKNQKSYLQKKEFFLRKKVAKKKYSWH
jgi:hypothetical protein